jgi:cytochrome c551/c552
LPEEKDPVTTPSLATFLVIVSVLLTLTLVWALYNEFSGLRPWKSYQREFASRYRSFLRKEIPKQKLAGDAILKSPEYQRLDQQLKTAEAQVKDKSEALDRQIAVLDARFSTLTDTFTTARAYVATQVYAIEHTSASGQESIQKGLAKYEAGPFDLALPTLPDGHLQKGSYTFQQLEEEFNSVQLDKAKLLEEKAAALRPISELRKTRDAYLTDHLNGLTADQLHGLLEKVNGLSVEIRQINNPDAGIVDRCESCHMGIREPVVLTAKDMGGKKVFVSHPDPELLALHDPEKFGCSPCHGGDGMAVESVEKAHGNYEHWLWPLHPHENVQAGCQQCHASDMFVDHAPVLSSGKELFQYRGCVGCHRFQNYDPEPEQLVAVQQQVLQLENQRHDAQRDVQRSIEMGDQAPDNDTARAYYTQADKLRVSISDIDGRIEQLDRRSKDLLRDTKKVGPDLKEVRVKIQPNWIPVWISNPHAWRPTTRMPRFRLNYGEVKAISAFIWQSGLDATLPQQPPGDPVKGKESFETRGCMGCHSLSDSDPSFAANLSRVGEKDNYDYLVRWIHNPRERTRPYCPVEKRDLTEDDYKRHGLPFVFDLDHSKCPNDGHELQVEQMTIMPNLRLSIEEARDIASYLITLKQKDPATYLQAGYLNDAKLKAQGHALVERYGCAGCHEIAGMEEEGRIGTELTKEGSKPLEQIDFALLTGKAEKEDWYSHKGFFEHKLEKPEIYDTGRDWKDRDPDERLRMPDFDMKPEEITALTTFLMGAVDSQIPARYWDAPEDQRRDIQEGWWVVKKYNCMGCHQFMVGQTSRLMTLPRYQTPEWKDQLPPKLMGEGARANPDWMLKFLSNPALDPKDTDRDGVRPYLKVRMPTFFFSPVELRKLVRFFQALSGQPMPYIAPPLEPLSEQEIAMARALFTSKAAPCLKCHATGDPAHDKFATAPNFLLARDRLKPGWARRWMLDPSMISPGTAMPSGLFKPVADHYVFAGPTPDIFKGYDGDQPELLVRYMFEITPEEQRRLVGLSASTLKSSMNRAAPAVPYAGPATQTEALLPPRRRNTTLASTLIKAHN